MGQSRRYLQKKPRVYCTRCRTETNHQVEGEYSVEVSLGEEFQILKDEVVYRLLRCAGCDSGMLEECYISRNITEDGEVFDDEFEYTYYPQRPKHERIGSLAFNRRSGFANLYFETVEAFNSDLYLLCTAGLRASVEAICNDKGITGKNLEKKIDGLASLVPQEIVTGLHDLRFMGNEAIHELSVPTIIELRLAIRLCEDLINYLYDFGHTAKRLGEVRNSRQDNSEHRHS